MASEIAETFERIYFDLVAVSKKCTDETIELYNTAFAAVQDLQEGMKEDNGPDGAST